MNSINFRVILQARKTARIEIVWEKHRGIKAALYDGEQVVLEALLCKSEAEALDRLEMYATDVLAGCCWDPDEFWESWDKRKHEDQGLQGKRAKPSHRQSAA